MGDRIDFQQLKATVPITDVLARLEITHLTERGDTLRGCCPLCKHEDSRAFVVTPAKNTWYCFREKAGGDIIRLVARSRAVSDREAAEWISGAGKAADNASPAAEAPAASRKSSGFDPLVYQQSLDPDHDGLDYDGGTLRHFGGGYCAKGLHRGRLVLPIHGASGISGFVGIALKGEDPELLYPKDFKIPHYMGSEHIGEGTLYLASHPKDMLSAYEGGIENVVALLRPLTADTLVCLTALMREVSCTELEMLP